MASEPSWVDGCLCAPGSRRSAAASVASPVHTRTVSPVPGTDRTAGVPRCTFSSSPCYVDTSARHHPIAATGKFGSRRFPAVIGYLPVNASCSTVEHATVSFRRFPTKSTVTQPPGRGAGTIVACSPALERRLGILAGTGRWYSNIVDEGHSRIKLIRFLDTGWEDGKPVGGGNNEN